MTRKIVITSGKGGVGKTTITCGLGVTLAGLGYKVLLIDMDFGLNNLDVVMGVENKIVYDIIDVLEGKCLPRQALIQDFFNNNLYIFPSTHSYTKIKFGAKELINIIEQLERDFDYVLIDCPAGIDGGFKRAISCGSEHIIITTPHISAVRDASKVIMCLSGSFDKTYYIVNRARGDMIVGKEMLSIDSIDNFLHCNLLGVIPEDDCVSIQLYYGGRYDKNSNVQKSLNMIAENIISGTNKIFDCTKKYKGVVGFLRMGLRGKI